jgi:hypothetical protein
MEKNEGCRRRLASLEEAQANEAQGIHFRLAITGNVFVCTVP